ncbi:unnamed protein product [Psylliodes chrysocephalus]|uniref:HAT C-terminal dimerisation domain-containing protein n=1 Tax=Psylliodes chrysocephalus TaxID=3402493 RepID=A0A9P0G6P0_9CUCU|nr:unnamed protein product [Psylliodes chrysocephala]
MSKKHPTLPITRQPALSVNNEETGEDNLIQTAIAGPSTAHPPQPKRFCPLRTQNILQYFHKPLPLKKQKEIDRQLVVMIAKEYHPFSIVEDKEFIKFIHLLNPSYKLPTRKTVSASLIPATYDEIHKTVKIRLNRAFAICLTTDGWTSRSNDSFYSVTAHYIVEDEKNTYLASDLLGCVSYTERHTGENIANKITCMLAEWDINNKITAVVTDNAANMKLAVRIGSWRHWGCFAHSLNLVTQSGLKEIQEVLDKIKVIVRFFHKSSHAYSKLKETQERMELPILKLKNDVPTRWNSTYAMIHRVLETKNALISTLALLNVSLATSDEQIPLLTSEEWTIVEQSMQILQMFDVVTTTLSAESKVTVSSLIIYYRELSKHLKSFNGSNLKPEVENLVKKLLSELNRRFGDMEDNELISQSTILDPRFKKFGFINAEKYKKAVQKLYHKIANTRVTNVNSTIYEQVNNDDFTADAPKTKKDNPLDILWKDFDSEIQMHTKPRNALAAAIVELDKYLDEPILPRQDSEGVSQDPLLWCHQRRYIYPRLYQIVKTRLCVMATSVPCERIFSHAGQTVNEKRERLTT